MNNNLLNTVTRQTGIADTFINNNVKDNVQHKFETLKHHKLITSC